MLFLFCFEQFAYLYPIERSKCHYRLHRRNFFTWFRGEKMTVHEFLDWAAKAYGTMEIIKMPTKEQSDYLLNPLRYEKVLVSDEGRGVYRLPQTEYELLTFRAVGFGMTCA